MTPTGNSSAANDWPAAVSCGFATALGMWVLAYIAKLDGGWLGNRPLLILLSFVPIMAGYYVSRRACRGIIAAAKAALIAGLVNLLVVLSVIGEQAGIISLLWIPGSLVSMTVLGTLGGLAAARFKKLSPPPWRFHFSMMVMLATVFLIGVGGLVTSNDAGLAVPDWPASYGYVMFFFPLSKMVGGIFYEHAHRLFGSLVGLFTIVLATWAWISDPRSWARQYGIVLLALVIAQGVLGGLRVELLSTSLAVFHAALAQTFLAMTAGMALFVSPFWEEGKLISADVAGGLRRLGLVTLALVYGQMVIGALLRHFGGSTVLMIHLALAAVVLMLTVIFVLRVLIHHANVCLLPRMATILLTLMGCQVVLGVGAWALAYGKSAPQPQMVTLVATSHVVVGALILAASTVLTLQVLRCSDSVKLPMKVAPA